MPKKYIPQQFAPRLYAEWGELLEGCTTEKKAMYLMAIIKFPNIDIPDDPIWNFLKSQIEKDYFNFVETCRANSRNARNYWADKNKDKGERSLSSVIPSLTNANEGEPKQKHITETKTETETETKTGMCNVNRKINKNKDPYINPFAQIFKDEYKKVFGKKLYLDNRQTQKICELSADIEDFENTIPVAISKLKNIDFGFDNYTPDVNWLLKDSNYTAVLNGVYDAKEKKGDSVIEEWYKNEKVKLAAKGIY